MASKEELKRRLRLINCDPPEEEEADSSDYAISAAWQARNVDAVLVAKLQGRLSKNPEAERLPATYILPPGTETPSPSQGTEY